MHRSAYCVCCCNKQKATWRSQRKVRVIRIKGHSKVIATDNRIWWRSIRAYWYSHRDMRLLCFSESYISHCWALKLVLLSFILLLKFELVQCGRTHSGVWKYFDKTETTDDDGKVAKSMTCKVENDGNACGSTFPHHLAGIASNHLRLKHPHITDYTKRTYSAPSPKKKIKLDPKMAQEARIARLLSKLTISINLFSDKDFHELVTLYDKKYEVKN